jgi:hypothetical protein
MLELKQTLKIPVEGDAAVHICVVNESCRIVNNGKNHIFTSYDLPIILFEPQIYNFAVIDRKAIA